MLTAANFSIYFVYHCSYSLYEPNHTVLREYKGGLEKAILRNSILLDECKTPPWLAQKVCTRSAHAAVSEVCAGALLNKAQSMCRKQAGEFLHDVRAINAIKVHAVTIFLTKMANIPVLKITPCACSLAGLVEQEVHTIRAMVMNYGRIIKTLYGVH